MNVNSHLNKLQLNRTEMPPKLVRDWEVVTQ